MALVGTSLPVCEPNECQTFKPRFRVDWISPRSNSTILKVNRHRQQDRRGWVNRNIQCWLRQHGVGDDLDLSTHTKASDCTSGTIYRMMWTLADLCDTGFGSNSSGKYGLTWPLNQNSRCPTCVAKVAVHNSIFYRYRLPAIVSGGRRMVVFGCVGMLTYYASSILIRGHKSKCLSPLKHPNRDSNPLLCHPDPTKRLLDQCG